MRFSALTERVARTGTGGWAVHQDAMRLRDAGADVIFLTIGDPDQAPPEALIEATVAALRDHRTGYSPTVGYPALREAIAARHARRTGQPCAADNVVVVPGAQGGLYCALQCLAGPGDEVIVPEPIYATYEGVVGASGARMVTVPLRAERGFHPDLDALAAAVTPRTRVVWINSPHNPTGAVFTATEIEAIAALCRDHDLWLLSDEVYEDLAFARPHVSPWSLPDMADRTVVVSSLSKSHAVPAFRLGWVIGPPALCRHLFNLLLCMTYGSPAFIQDGALAALARGAARGGGAARGLPARAAMLCDLLPKRRIAGRAARRRHVRAARRSGQRARAPSSSRSSCSSASTSRCCPATASARAPPAICASRCRAPDARLAEAGRRIVRFARRLARAPSLAPHLAHGSGTVNRPDPRSARGGGGVAEQMLDDHAPAKIVADRVFLGHANAAMQLDRVLRNEPGRLTNANLGHRNIVRAFMRVVSSTIIAANIAMLRPCSNAISISAERCCKAWFCPIGLPIADAFSDIRASTHASLPSPRPLRRRPPRCRPRRRVR